jgi:hypothetical protein
VRLNPCMYMGIDFAKSRSPESIRTVHRRRTSGEDPEAIGVSDFGRLSVAKSENSR